MHHYCDYTSFVMTLTLYFCLHAFWNMMLKGELDNIVETNQNGERSKMNHMHLVMIAGMKYGTVSQ